MILYLDNYRGFKNQFIDTTEVNLLVGENSTGKSSFLSILCLLSHPDFLIKGTFKNEFVDLGPFDEIINQIPYKNTIQIGVLKGNNKLNSIYNSSLDAVILKFKSQNGYPKIDDVLLINGRSALWYKLNKNNIEYILYQIENKVEIKDLILTYSKSSKLELKVLDTGEIGSSQEDRSLHTLITRYFFSITYFIRESVPAKNKILYKDFESHSFVSENLILKGNTVWIAPIRSEPKRIYEPSEEIYSADGTHVPNTLRRIFTDSTLENKKTVKGLIDYGKGSGLFDKIEIEDYQKERDLSPFELNILLSNRKLRITNVGYGVSQSLPIVTEIFRRRKGTGFLIQQPEVHLHPKAQAQMGELILKQTLESNKVFFIETHSDYIIDRIRMLLKKSKKKNLDGKVSLLFFERNEEGNQVTKISIDNKGNIDSNQPNSYREFFVKEQLDLLGYDD
jgi:predicted ATPase